MFDSLTVSMFVVVNTVSALVHTYSVFYMEKDAHLTRFMSYLSLFTFFMLILVSADNFIQLFLGWEGVGLCSYLLINFWFSRVQANKAALKAIIMNRVGDFGLTFAILLIFFYFKSVDFGVVFLLAPILSDFFFTINFNLFFLTLNCNIHVMSFICFFFVCGCCRKIRPSRIAYLVTGRYGGTYPSICVDTCSNYGNSRGIFDNKVFAFIRVCPRYFNDYGFYWRNYFFFCCDGRSSTK